MHVTLRKVGPKKFWLIIPPEMYKTLLKQSLIKLGGIVYAESEYKNIFEFPIEKTGFVLDYLEDQKIRYFNSIPKIEVSNYGNSHAIVRGDLELNYYGSLLKGDLDAKYEETPNDEEGKFGSGGYVISNENAVLFLEALQRKKIPHMNLFKVVEVVQPEVEPETVTIKTSNYNDAVNVVRDLMKKYDKLEQSGVADDLAFVVDYFTDLKTASLLHLEEEESP